MNGMHLSRTPRRGLGLLWTAQGLALSQTQMAGAPGASQQDWHWQALPPDQEGASLTDWPDPKALRMARQCSGFQAQAVALAVPESQLMRMSLNIEPGLASRPMLAQIQAQLAPLLPWALADTVWDFQLSKAEPVSASRHQGPAWLQAAMQAQAQQTVDVVAVPRAWVTACEQWCRAAGLHLVRLEPAWQADARWQNHCAQHSKQTAWPLPRTALSAHQQAVLGGLALGVVTP